MKVVRNTAAFVPVTITLETQEELDIFTTVFYYVGGDKVARVFGSCGAVYNRLSAAGGQTDDSGSNNSIHVN